jgi:hypothetical protein
MTAPIGALGVLLDDEVALRPRRKPVHNKQ